LPAELASILAGERVMTEDSGLTATVALPPPLIGQPCESVPALSSYVVVAAGLTVKANGLEPVCVPPPLFKVTL